MKVLSLIALLALTCFALAQTDAALTAASDLDLSEYSGLWYEIATIPSFFEKACYCSTSDYTLTSDSTFEVRNVCNFESPSGTLIVDKATLSSQDSVEDGVTSGNWSIDYLGFLNEPYYVIYVDPDYSYALVGSPKRSFLWIISRQPTLDDDTYNQLLSMAASDGFDTSKVVKTYQGDDCNYSDDESF